MAVSSDSSNWPSRSRLPYCILFPFLPQTTVFFSQKSMPSPTNRRAVICWLPVLSTPSDFVPPLPESFSSFRSSRLAPELCSSSCSHQPTSVSFPEFLLALCCAERGRGFGDHGLALTHGPIQASSGPSIALFPLCLTEYTGAMCLDSLCLLNVQVECSFESHFTDWKTEAQRGWIIWIKSHS